MTHGAYLKILSAMIPFVLFSDSSIIIYCFETVSDAKI